MQPGGGGGVAVAVAIAAELGCMGVLKSVCVPDHINAGLWGAVHFWICGTALVCLRVCLILRARLCVPMRGRNRTVPDKRPTPPDFTLITD
jgi:hypothetical protein